MMGMKHSVQYIVHVITWVGRGHRNYGLSYLPPPKVKPKGGDVFIYSSMQGEF